MPKKPHPETLGVFAPVDHVFISFPTVQDMEGAASALGRQGYRDDQVMRYSAEQMRTLVDADIAHASPLASLGQEINLARAHGELADQGYSFLVVHAPKTQQAREVADIAATFNAERAQKYGNFLIEELIAPAGAEDAQVFESPARGLDAH